MATMMMIKGSDTPDPKPQWSSLSDQSDTLNMGFTIRYLVNSASQ